MRGGEGSLTVQARKSDARYLVGLFNPMLLRSQGVDSIVCLPWIYGDKKKESNRLIKRSIQLNI